jgi:hypothetical protein
VPGNTINSFNNNSFQVSCTWQNSEIENSSAQCADIDWQFKSVYYEFYRTQDYEAISLPGGVDYK